MSSPRLAIPDSPQQRNQLEAEAEGQAQQQGSPRIVASKRRHYASAIFEPGPGASRCFRRYSDGLVISQQSSRAQLEHIRCQRVRTHKLWGTTSF
jgi:hypothetical protein